MSSFSKTPVPQHQHPVRILAKIVGHQPLGPSLGMVTLEGPGVGRDIQAGQFAMLWRPPAPGALQSDEPRPFAYFDAPDVDHVSFLVRERPLAAASLLRASLGTQVPLQGPLGKPFPLLSDRTWVIAGGVGAAAFGPLAISARLWPRRMLLGLHSGAEGGIEAALKVRFGDHTEIVTAYEDAEGHETALSLLARSLKTARQQPDMLFACGPQGLLQEVAMIAREHKTALWVSVGVAMHCGVGRCRSCEITDHEGHAHLACVDGPIYSSTILYGP